MLTWEPLSRESTPWERLVYLSVVRPWGWAPLCALLTAVALVVVAGGMSVAWSGAASAQWLFWCGVIALFLPSAARLLSEDATRKERLALVVQLALALYLVKYLHSPVVFTFYDELLHWRTASDILRAWRLFQPNPLLPVSPYYPGLENATVALVQVGGLELFDAGILLLAAARLLFIVALYLFYEHTAGSPRIAGLAALLYMANPAFVFFDKQFAYESLALPFAAALLWAQTQRDRDDGEHRAIFRVLVVLSLVAVIVTHHLTAYALTAFLLLWEAVARWKRRRSGVAEPGPGWLAIAALVGTLAWMFSVARITIPYLGGNFRSTLSEILALMTGELEGRTLFQGFAGEVAPWWERLTGLLSVLLITLLLVPGFRRVRHRYRQVLPITLAVTAPLYLASQVLRFSSFGLQISSRIPEFVFVPLAFVLALGLAEVWPGREPDRLRRGAILLGVGIIFVGGVILGWPRWARLPGPYLVSADSRSIEAESLAAAEWSREVWGEGQRVAADRINALLLLAYGGQDPVTASFSGVDVPRLFLSPRLGPTEMEILRQGEIRYLVVDRRLSTSLPIGGVYWELGETDTGRHEQPIPASALTKFDGLAGAQRVFDSGNIVIYDVAGAAASR